MVIPHPLCPSSLDMGFIHIYSQSWPHDDAYIVANRKGLEALQKAIAEALDKGESKFDAWVTDGEGYSLNIIFRDGDWDTPFWKNLAVPYTGDTPDEWPVESRSDAVWPWKIGAKEGDDGKTDKP